MNMMNRTKVHILAVICGVGLLLVGNVVPNARAGLSTQAEKTARAQILNGKGLVGVYYNDDNFDEEETGMIDVLGTVDYNWGGDRGSDWAARWYGFIEGPTTGEVTFTAEVRDGLRLTIGNAVVIDSLSQSGICSGKVNMTRGQKVPVKVEFVCSNKKALLQLWWQWAGKAKAIVPASVLSHSSDGLPKKFLVFDFDNRPSEQDKNDDAPAGRQYAPGLVGTYFNSRNFTEPDMSVDILKGLDIDWEKARGNDWSAKWHGFLEGPVTGKVKFFVDVKDAFQLNIEGNDVIDGLDESASREGEYVMEKGKKYPITVDYISLYGQAKIHLYWEWAGQARTIVPGSAYSYDASRLPKNFRRFDYDNRVSEGDKADEGFAAELPAFVGGEPPYANTDYLDGQLRPAVGAHSFEVIRCNRTHPELVTEKIPNYPDAGFRNTGFTYNHQPMICYWQGKLWVIYESGPANEHQPPCYALVTWSADGRNWHKPQTIFPAEKFRNRQKDNHIEYSISHQRMDWYVAPDGRLIASSFYGMRPSPNNGKGIGRAVREIKGPGQYGPIYWVRYNKYQGYNKDNSPHFPYYKEAPDKGFVKAIDSLLANKLMVQQWYEEDRDETGGFFSFVPSKARYGKAFAWYTLPDGRIVGMWKWKKMVVANKWEPGQISQQGSGKDIYYGGAKIWGQRTSDGKYALIYNPVKNTTWRHPLSVTTSSDGMNFDTYLLNAHGETPLMRFGGANKDGGGAQYVRGIIPGNGTPPDGAIWLTYSSNKEDIWVCRVPVPVKGTVDKDVDDDFEDMTVDGVVTNWNVYTGVWNPVAVVKEKGNKVLRLADKDPYDYAKAVRVFPETIKARISFDLKPKQIGRDGLEIEVQNYKGQRPVRIVINGKNGVLSAGSKWVKVVIDVDTIAAKYNLSINGRKVVSGGAFAEAIDNTNDPYKSKFSAPTVERVVFRTGSWRMKDFSRYGFGANDYRKNEPDLKNADEAVAEAVFEVDNLRTITIKP